MNTVPPPTWLRLYRLNRIAVIFVSLFFPPFLPPSTEYVADDIIALGPQATTVYDAMANNGVPREAVQLDRQLCLYDDLFGWARITFTALTDRPPPDIHFGPTALGI